MRSKSQKESCKYLSIFTQTLVDKYSGRDLRSSNLAAVVSASDWETSLLPYKEFYENARAGYLHSVYKIWIVYNLNKKFNILLNDYILVPVLLFCSF